MATVHLYAAWIGIILGFTAGAVLGLFHHRDNWLGGYPAWPRRMARLGHISFFGLAFINLAYGVTLLLIPAARATPYPSLFFLAGAATMPLACFLAAWRRPLRHLFYIPVLCLFGGAAILLTTISKGALS